jgi:hypothetical protein
VEDRGTEFSGDRHTGGLGIEPVSEAMKQPPQATLGVRWMCVATSTSAQRSQGEPCFVIRPWRTVAPLA